MKIPLFPLEIYLLPDGINKLRIYESRYCKLVKLACTNPNGFGLCMMMDDKICHFGTRAIITDFYPLPDGSLGITVKGVETFLINNSWQDEDGLYMGNVTPVPNWHNKKINFSNNDISNSLKQLFEKHPQHAKYYPAPDFDNLTWVCQRWLEILPLDISQKQWFMSRSDHKAALSFLHTIIDNHISD